MTESFLFKHCAECGRRIPHDQIRCVEHKIEDYGSVSVQTLELNTEKDAGEVEP